MLPSIRQINVPDAPAAIGPYSQARVVEGEGRLVIVPRMISPDLSLDIKGQTQSLLKLVSQLLQEQGSDLEHVLRMDVFMKDLSRDFQMMNTEYGKWFEKSSPARQTVQPADLPNGVQVAMSCTAVAQSLPGFESCSGLLLASGQVAIDPVTGKLVDKDLPQQILRNLKAILQGSRYSLSDMTRLDVFLKNPDQDTIPLLQVLQEVISKTAIFLIPVEELPLGTSVEISCIARKGG